ncbi:MAG TPA: UDP binding domain-containing protein, partial [Kaistiaceae bacterium]|nr:UDP binding domain-containing protein [Kaistiaceae bacterium]
GLVGGHCIGVDPYYLTAKAETVGYHPQVILAGRRINDNMGSYVAQRLIKLLVQRDHQVRQTRIGILGLTFKENVPDLRNSRVPDIIAELEDYGIEPLVHDAMADAREAVHEYGVTLSELGAFRDLDAVILAVPHKAYLAGGSRAIAGHLKPGGIVIDVKSALDPADLPEGIGYWSL